MPVCSQVQGRNKKSASRRKKVSGSHHACVCVNYRVCLQLVLLAYFSVLGSQVFEKPEEDRKEGKQLVCQNGEHQRNPGPNSYVTD